jgi:hypothetical protein
MHPLPSKEKKGKYMIKKIKKIIFISPREIQIYNENYFVVVVVVFPQKDKK